MTKPTKIILADGSVRYRGRIDVGRDPITGKRRQTTITAATKREYDDLVAAARTSVVGGQATGVSPSLTLAAYLGDHWLPHKHALGTLRTSTLYLYNQVVTHSIIPALGGIRLTKLRPIDIQQWVHRRAAATSVTTARGEFAVLAQAIRQAHRWRMIPFNPADGVVMPRAERSPQVTWTMAETERFLTLTADRPYHVAWCLLARTGLRVGELAALTWNDVALDVPSVTVRRSITTGADGRETLGERAKTDHSLREILLDADTAAALGAWAKTALLLFPGQKPGRPITTGTLRRHLQLDCDHAGMPRLNPHAFRHAHATHMMEAEIHPSVAMHRLGHASMTMLSRYTHPRLANQQGVISRLSEGKCDKPVQVEEKSSGTERKSS